MIHLQQEKEKLAQLVVVLILSYCEEMTHGYWILKLKKMEIEGL